MVTLPPSVQQPQNDFTVALEKFDADTNLKLDIILRKVALDLLAGVVYRTPVDTGRARGGWQAGVDFDPVGDTARLDPNGAETVQAGNEEISTANAESTVYIANNVEYAPVLESGWSKQAPYGMLRVTIVSFPYLVEAAAKEVDTKIQGSAA